MAPERGHARNWHFREVCTAISGTLQRSMRPNASMWFSFSMLVKRASRIVSQNIACRKVNVENNMCLSSTTASPIYAMMINDRSTSSPQGLIMWQSGWWYSAKSQWAFYPLLQSWGWWQWRQNLLRTAAESSGLVLIIRTVLKKRRESCTRAYTSAPSRDDLNMFLKWGSSRVSEGVAIFRRKRARVFEVSQYTL